MTTTGGASASVADGQLDPRGADDLVEAIWSARPELEDAAVRAEELRTLPPEIVQRLRDLGLFWLKTPAELGGRPLHPLAFSDVLEAVAYCDASAAWATMIGCGSTGIAAGGLPDAGAARVFSSREELPVVAGQPQPRGRAVSNGEGVVVTGRWSFASGIHHSNWVLGAATVEAPPNGEANRVLAFVIEKAKATVYDNWHVAGLEGTGSSDFSLDEVLIPHELTFSRPNPRTASAVATVISGGPRRGGPLFNQQGPLLFVANEVPGFCVGVALRAIDDMTALAGQTVRFFGGVSLADRAVFQKELGLAKAKVAAARLYYRDAMGRAFDATVAGKEIPVDVLQAAALSQPFVAETCVQVVSDLFRYGGGRALALSHPMQRHLRNLLAARQHGAASEAHYENTGRAMLEEWKARHGGEEERE
jgi:alkylation response protein AidB-like acyl-CoA dehydrogenase